MQSQLVYSFAAPFVRVYFNRGRESKDKVWSVDFGPGTVEMLAAMVHIMHAPARTQYDPSCAEPRAWVEFVEAKIEITGDGIFILDGRGNT